MRINIKLINLKKFKKHNYLIYFIIYDLITQYDLKLIKNIENKNNKFINR